MALRAWRFAALLLSALALTSAHLLELPQKLTYDASLYSAVNSTLYRYFAIVGGVYSMGSIVTTVLLAFLVRGRGRVFHWTLAASLLLALWFASWLVLVVPVNREIATALEVAPQGVPALWLELRGRWEYGHAFGFVLQLLGFGALLISVLLDTPATTTQRRG